MKPEFWTSLPVASLSFAARLTFIGLWNYADDEGRGVDDARLIGAAVWPLDNDRIGVDDVEQHLADIMAAELIVRYAVGDRSYFEVVNWNEHQHPNRPIRSKFPAPNERSVKAHGVLTNGSVQEGRGREGKGEERNGLASKYLAKLAADSPKVWGSVTVGALLEIAAEYDFDAAAAGRMLGDVWAWWHASPGKRWKSAALRGFRSWCKREAERRPKDTGAEIDPVAERRAKIRDDLTKRVQGDFGRRTAGVVSKTLARFPDGDLDHLERIARRIAKEGA